MTPCATVPHSPWSAGARPVGPPASGAAFSGVLYVDSLSEEGGPVPTYLDLLRVTTETIARGLSQAE